MSCKVYHYREGHGQPSPVSLRLPCLFCRLGSLLGESQGDIVQGKRDTTHQEKPRKPRT